ncbi:MAG TPA: amidohydrolase family protein, partial [Acidimicrobiales bacterium]|nr:amidohydrolase family protein [Acidimicrobiales bacterium]
MLISGGTVVDVDGSRRADVRVGPDGRIARAGIADARELVYDATGCLVVPGGVDAHTHLHLPVGHVRVSDDFETGTRAAAVGGTTTIVDYVTAYRGEEPMTALATWKRWAEPAAVDVGLHMTFTEAVSEQTIARCIEAGVTSFKLYMAYPQLLQVDDGVIVDIMRMATRHGGLVTVHCENGGAIEALRRRALAEGRTGVIEHANTRPAILEGEATARAAAL